MTLKNIKKKISKGSIISNNGLWYELLEDSTYHGCPFVTRIDKNLKRIGKKFAMTLYLHTGGHGIISEMAETYTPINRFEILDIR